MTLSSEQIDELAGSTKPDQTQRMRPKIGHIGHEYSVVAS